MNCKKCGYKLSTEKDFERNLCYGCYVDEFFTYDCGKSSSTGPRYFTFSDEEIDVYELNHPPKTQLELINDFVKQKGVEAEIKRKDLLNNKDESILFNKYMASKEPGIFTFSDEDIKENNKIISYNRNRYNNESPIFQIKTSDIKLKKIKGNKITFSKRIKNTLNKLFK